MNRHATVPVPDVVVEVRGELPAGIAALARTKIRSLTSYLRDPVLHARIKLTVVSNPAVAEPAIAQANLNVNGRLVRAQVTATTMRAAIDLLQARLRSQLDRRARHWEARRGRTATPQASQWRHDSEPARQLDHYPRPEDEREVVRHKSFTLERETPDEAAFELDTMDYDFHLFTDEDTGLDSVIYRAGPTGYRLAQVSTRTTPLAAGAVQVTLSEQPAPQLTVADAIVRLELTGQRFVFFATPDSNRGRVLYHRYDGHYGLITPTA